MRILAIESSCDETSAAIVEKNGDGIFVKSELTATSLQMHAATGGIIPENAARMQLQYILPVIYNTILTSVDIQTNNKHQSNLLTPSEIKKANIMLRSSIDAIAVTYGPGLIGSLLVGVETAKTLAFAFNKKVIPVNHLLGHIYANFINSSNSKIPTMTNPFIGLVISGGHTDLLYFPGDTTFKWLGGTRDDAAGEAFDKIGRVLNLPYPAGAEIERRALLSEKSSIKFKSPIINEDNFDFSFSGLKSEAMRYAQKEELGIYLKSPEKLEDPQYHLKLNETCSAVQKAIFDVVIKKTIRAAEKLNCNTILVGGGVSANNALKEELGTRAMNLGIDVFFPPQKYSTDNAAMIGAYAAIHPELQSWENVGANPELYFA